MRRSEDFLLQNVGDQHVLVPLGGKVKEQNGLIVLNNTAHRVWELLAEDVSTEGLAAEIAKEFNIEEARALADVKVFVEEVSHLGLLEG